MAAGKRVPAPRRQSRFHLGKAHEFLEASRGAEAAGLNDAALSAAIHAGVCAADAVCSALAGTRSADPDHTKAADLLEELGGAEAKAHAAQLRRLVSKKHEVEYTARRSSARDAADAIKRAQRLVAWASAVVENAGL